MKIGIDATALYGRFGGVELALWNLLDALRQITSADNSYQWVIYLPSDGPKSSHWDDFGTNWRFVRLTFRGSEKARRIAWQQTQLASMARRDGCDILHCPTYVCPLRSSVPIVLTIYDFIALTHPQFATKWNRAHYGWMLPRCARRANSIIVPSPSVQRELSRRVSGAHGKTHCVPLAVEEEFFARFSPDELATARAKWNLPPRFLLFVGNPEPKKNLPAILDAMRQLPSQWLGIPLVHTGGARAWKEHQIGTTYFANAHENLLSTQHEPQTLGLGYLERHELPLLYALCSAFVFPSLVEGFGLPVLEALACGAPVVCSNRVPIENLDRAALICEPNDTAQLSQHIAQVLQDAQLRDDLCARGRTFARAYSWKQTAQMTLDVYAGVRK